MKAIAVLLLLLCGGFYVWENVCEQVPGITDLPSDFSNYYRAAQAWRSGRSPYADAGYDYPPLIAAVVLPLAHVSYVRARWIWFILSHLCLLAAAYGVWRLLGGGLPAAVCVACVWAFTGPAGENLGLGQVGPLLLLLIVIALCRSGSVQGLALGTATALKLFPAMLGIALLAKRDRRALAAMTAAAALLMALPWSLTPGAKSPVRPDYWMGTPALLNWSLPASALRAAEWPHGSALPPNWLLGNNPAELRLSRREQFLSVGVAVLTLALGLVWLWRKGRVSSMPALMSLTLAAAPICWTHYQILQYPALAMLLHTGVQARRWRVLARAALFGALLYRLPVAVLTSYYRHHGWSAASVPALYFWTSVTPLAALALFVYCSKVLPADASFTSKSAGVQ
jgi:hypothetical protein